MWDGSTLAFCAIIYVTMMTSKTQVHKEESLPNGQEEDQDSVPDKKKQILFHLLTAKA